MDRSALRPIVKLGLRLESQISANISRQTAKTSLICVKTKIWKNDLLSQLLYLADRAFPYPRLAQGDSPSPGPSLAHTHTAAPSGAS